MTDAVVPCVVDTGTANTVAFALITPEGRWTMTLRTHPDRRPLSSDGVIRRPRPDSSAGDLPTTE